ncbi:MAG: 5-oxoprolinase subunit PxpB [Deltaproteobacteria bacterium]|nr:5-oxoprolinase subunit PxpB [Deltaproteobacteria bacterium]
MSTLYDKPRIRICGDRAIIVEYGAEIDRAVNEKVRAMAALLKRSLPAGVEAVIPAYRSLSLLYNPLATSTDQIAKTVEAREADFRQAEIAKPRVVEIPVCYGGEFGPDLEIVADQNHLTIGEVIAIHTSVDYHIYMIGFAPGFCYLGGLDRRLHTPRRKTPRTKLPAGSVGIAESQTGMYPQDSPGGWQIIGRTPRRLFAPWREEPFLYQAGDRVRFVAIPEETFRQIREMEWQ